MGVFTVSSYVACCVGLSGDVDPGGGTDEIGAARNVPRAPVDATLAQHVADRSVSDTDRLSLGSSNNSAGFFLSRRTRLGLNQAVEYDRFVRPGGRNSMVLIRLSSGVTSSNHFDGKVGLHRLRVSRGNRFTFYGRVRRLGVAAEFGKCLRAGFDARLYQRLNHLVRNALDPLLSLRCSVSQCAGNGGNSEISLHRRHCSAQTEERLKSGLNLTIKKYKLLFLIFTIYFN